MKKIIFMVLLFCAVGSVRGNEFAQSYTNQNVDQTSNSNEFWADNSPKKIYHWGPILGASIIGVSIVVILICGAIKIYVSQRSAPIK